MSSMFIPLSFSPLQQPVQIPSAAFVIFLVSKHVGGKRSPNSELRVWTYKSLYGVFITFFTLFCCSKYIHIKEVLCGFSKFELLMVQPWSFTLQQWRAEKDWLTMYFILLLHMLDLFMMSVLQTTWHKTGNIYNHDSATFEDWKSETRMTARILKQDPNT